MTNTKPSREALYLFLIQRTKDPRTCQSVVTIVQNVPSPQSPRHYWRKGDWTPQSTQPLPTLRQVYTYFIYPDFSTRDFFHLEKPSLTLKYVLTEKIQGKRWGFSLIHNKLKNNTLLEVGQASSYFCIFFREGTKKNLNVNFFQIELDPPLPSQNVNF